MRINTWFLIKIINTNESAVELDQKLEIINVGKELFYEKNYPKIKFDTDNDLPLNKSLKFPTLTIIVRSVFEENKKCILSFI